MAVTWPVTALPAQARAILLLPAGFRAFDEDFTVDLPVPPTLSVDGADYDRVQIHHGGMIDQDARVLYVLGGRYLPHGAERTRLDPDEAHEQ